jgi:phospholipid/cholesterol/gamma-HCH transport system substrate-binding protein
MGPSAILKAKSFSPLPQGETVPSRKDIQWSQLRVGALVLVAVAVLVGLVFLMTGSTGGPFAHKTKLRAYFNNAAGIKVGAPVTLEGVTIGNVSKIKIVPERNPNPVEATMQVDPEYMYALHTDSTAAIAQAGVLGDSYVDISSESAKGPRPTENSELRSAGAPSIQDVIRNSDISLDSLNNLMHKVSTLIDTLNSEHGTAGKFINDPGLYNKISKIADNLDVITADISQGKGSIGKFVTDDTLYTRANTAVDSLNRIVADLDAGKGTAGKLLKDETLYNNLNATVANTNQIIADINAGKGSLGKLAKDEAFAKRLDDTVSRLDDILNSVEQGKGTIGQLMVNRSLYDHVDQTMDQSQQLVKAIREDPKKYFVIRLKLF